MRTADAARALVGARFRLGGRAPDTGLDCVGVAAIALAAAGVRVVPPRGYALRGGDPTHATAVLDGLLMRAAYERPGDVVLMRPGPGQLHLGVRTPGGMVHADAGLGRVVERPGAPPWAVLGVWRTEGD